MGKTYGEMCRAYGVLPHELPPRGTPERRFMEIEWQERVKEHNKRMKEKGSGQPGMSAPGRRIR